MGTTASAASASALSKDRHSVGPAADEGHPLLPESDPIAAQRAACEAVSRFLQVDAPDARQLEVLLTLDRHARRTSNRLLRRYVEGNAQLQVFQRQDWSAALRLSQSFFAAYQHLWRQMKDSADGDWLPHAHRILFQLFHHRHVEFVLRFIRYKKRTPALWEEVHQIYRFALARGIARVDVAADRSEQMPAKTTTLEQRFIRLLLLDVVSNGQLSPREVLWADDWLSRWCKGLRLQSREEQGANRTAHRGFAVDLDAADGLKRVLPSIVTNAHFLDTSPLIPLIEEELRSRAETDSRHDMSATATRAGQAMLLKKLAGIVGPAPVRIKRRGERSSVALAVEGIAGFADIVQVLREEARMRPGGASGQEAPEEGVTISPLSAEAYSPALPAGAGIDSEANPVADRRAVVLRAWQVKDSSESGCRMRAQVNDISPLIPGALIMTRESEHGPWTLSVVRRFRRLMVDHVEIGVEFVGCRPRFVKLVADSTIGSVEKPGDTQARCFAALYLPPSDERPAIPIKTLLLPARYFDAGRDVTLMSANANYTLRLNQAIRQQFEFACCPFTVLHKQPVAAGAKPAGK